MADLQKTVDIIFGAVDNTGGAITSVASGVNSLADGVSTVTGPLSDLADNALLAEGAIIAMGVSMLGIAVNEAAKFQTSMVEIGTLFNATPEQVAGMTAEVESFATKSVFALDDTTSALYNMVSATGDTENAVAGLAASQELAVVGNSDLNTSVNAITTVLAAYGLQMDEAANVSDDLFTIIQSGKTTLPELSANIGTVAKTAESAGVPFEDLGAAIAAMTVSMGGKTPEAMTLLKSLFKELATPTDELKAAMGGMTLETDGLQAIMQVLNEKTGGSLAKMNELFSSTEAATGALILGKDSAGTFASTLASMGVNAGKVTENFAEMEKQLKFVTQNMQTNLTLALNAIGAELLPEWSAIVAAVSDIFSGVRVGLDNENFAQVFTALDQFLVAVENYAAGIAEVLPEAMGNLDFSGLLDAFGGLGDAIGGLFNGLDLTNAKDLEQALQFILDGVETLTRFVTGITTSWGPALTTIKDFVVAVNEGGDESKEMAGYIAGLGQQFETFKGLATGAAGALDAAGTALSVIAASSVANTLTTMAGSTKALTAALGVGGLWTAGGLAAGAVGYGVGTGLGWVIDEIIDSTTDSGSLGGLIYDLGEMAGVGSESKEEMAALQEEIAKLREQNKEKIRLEIEASADLPTEEIRDYDAEVNKLDQDTVKASESAAAYAEQMKLMGFTYKAVTSASGEVTGEWVKQADSAKKAGEGVDYLVTTMADGTKVYSQTTAGLVKANAAIKDTKDVSEKAADKVHELELKMLELASNEKIKNMEFTANIEIANIEADTERLNTIFESLNNTISSSSNNIASMFEGLAALGGVNGLQKLKIFEDQLKVENELRQEAFKLTEKLTNAQIKLMNARTTALKNGDSLIKITADGLEPELEAFMFKILERVQIAMTQDQDLFLAGAG